MRPVRVIALGTALLVLAGCSASGPTASPVTPGVAATPAASQNGAAPTGPAATSTPPGGTTSLMSTGGSPRGPIVYEGPIDGGQGIRIVGTDGTGDHWLFPDVKLPKGGWQVHPDWSPDGTRLAFAADDPVVAPGAEFTRDLWVGDADGANARRVFDCVAPCFVADDPAWSPDGRTLAFVTWGGPNPATLSLLDLGAGAVTTIVTEQNPSGFLWPRWSPDGRRIVLEHQTWTGGADEHIVDSTFGIVDLDAKTPAFTPLTTPEMWATYPDWHPARNLIVFSTRPWRDLDDGPSNLYSITPDGAGLAALTDFGPGETRAVQPTWLPDGSGVIFTAVEPFGSADPTMMAVIDADGSGLRPATALAGLFGTHPRLRPTP